MPIIVAMPLVMRPSGRTADFISIKHIPTIAFESSYIEKDYAPSLRSVKVLEAAVDTPSSVRGTSHIDASMCESNRYYDDQA